jgi:hypothetical protein
MDDIPLPDGTVHERTVTEHGIIEVPLETSGAEACVIDAGRGMVLTYTTVEDGGVVRIDERHAGTDVQVVIPTAE